MEKFSHFTDKATGIPPFKSTYRQPTFFTYIFHSALFLVKSVLFLAVLLFGILSYPFSSLYKIYLDIVLAYFFNVEEVDVSVDGVKKSDHAKLDSSKPQKSDIVFINATSPIDKLVWQMITQSPKNISVAVVGTDGELYLVPSSGCAYSNWCCGGSVEIPSKWVKLSFNSSKTSFNDEDLDEFKTHYSSAVGDNTLYIIPEGTITNNRGLLSFNEKFNLSLFASSLAKTGRSIKTATVKLVPMENTGTTLPINKFWWLFMNFGSMKMDIKYKIHFSILFDAGKDVDFDFDSLTTKLIREKMTNFGRLKGLSKELTVQSKIDYIKAIKEKNYL